jgi:hypothetical protein
MLTESNIKLAEIPNGFRDSLRGDQVVKTISIEGWPTEPKPRPAEVVIVKLEEDKHLITTIEI